MSKKEDTMAVKSNTEERPFKELLRDLTTKIPEEKLDDFFKLLEKEQYDPLVNMTSSCTKDLLGIQTAMLQSLVSEITIKNREISIFLKVCRAFMCGTLSTDYFFEQIAEIDKLETSGFRMIKQQLERIDEDPLIFLKQGFFPQEEVPSDVKPS
jgi:hypothetical protein